MQRPWHDVWSWNWDDKSVIGMHALALTYANIQSMFVLGKYHQRGFLRLAFTLQCSWGHIKQTYGYTSPLWGHSVKRMWHGIWSRSVHDPWSQGNADTRPWEWLVLLHRTSVVAGGELSVLVGTGKVSWGSYWSTNLLNHQFTQNTSSENSGQMGFMHFVCLVLNSRNIYQKTLK